MITYKDIKLAVNNLLISKTGLKINSNDVKEGFERPSFFVQLGNPTGSRDTSQVHKSITIQIYYFPTDRNKNSIELLDMQEQLENIFDLKFNVQDRFFNIDEPNSVVTDGVLSFSFDIEFYAAREMSYEDEHRYDDVITDEENGQVDENGNPINKIEIEIMKDLEMKG